MKDLQSVINYVETESSNHNLDNNVMIRTIEKMMAVLLTVRLKRGLNVINIQVVSRYANSSTSVGGGLII